MRIKAAADRSGVPAKTIRYYEEVGLIAPVGRADNGYREYSERDVEILRFIARARSMGFSVDDVRNLLSLWVDRRRASADVKAVARKHLQEVESKIKQLESIRQTLLHLMERCRGDARPDCPILDQLAEDDACH